jgi:hypothetical protein
MLTLSVTIHVTYATQAVSYLALDGARLTFSDHPLVAQND